jgi:hypothetical protein
MKSLVILCMAFSQTALAFTLQVDSLGTPILAWADSEIVFDVNYADCPAEITSEQLDGAIDSALGVWNSTSMTSLKLKRGDRVTTTVAQIKVMTGTRRPLIICDAQMGANLNPTGAPVETQNIPAVAQLLRLDSQGHIAGALVYLNAESGKSANIGNVFQLIPNLLTIVLAHEIGHVLGLGHSGDVNALMYYDASAKKQLALGEDDVRGAVYLYPRREIWGAVPFLGCGTVERGDRPRSGPGSAFPNGAAEFAALLLFCAAVSRVMAKGHEFHQILYRKRV